MGVGCLDVSDDASQTESALTPDPEFNHSGTTIATIPLGPASIEKKHLLHFVEFNSGNTGWVETGPADTAPIVTDKLRELSTVELFEHFSPGTAVPEALLAPSSAPPTSSTQPIPAIAAGPQPQDTAGEQAWFRDRFCLGARSCVEGWAWALSASGQKLQHEFGVAAVMSESTQNGTFWMDYWGNCDDGGCHYVNVWWAIVTPGHWVSYQDDGGGVFAWYRQWRIDGANSMVSLSTKW